MRSLWSASFSSFSFPQARYPPTSSSSSLPLSSPPTPLKNGKRNRARTWEPETIVIILDSFKPLRPIDILYCLLDEVGEIGIRNRIHHQEILKLLLSSANVMTNALRSWASDLTGKLLGRRDNGETALGCNGASNSQAQISLDPKSEE